MTKPDKNWPDNLPAMKKGQNHEQERRSETRPELLQTGGQAEGPKGTGEAQGKAQMTYEQKFRKLRVAVLDLMDLPEDNKGDLIGLLDSLIREKPADADEKRTQSVSLRLVVALLETHDSGLNEGINVGVRL